MEVNLKYVEFQNYAILKMTVVSSFFVIIIIIIIIIIISSSSSNNNMSIFFSYWILVHLADSSRIQCIHVDTNYTCIVLLRAISKVLAEPYLEIVIYWSG